MSQTHRIAIIGIGAIADIHARAIAQIEGAALVAGSCRTESKGRAFADQFNCQWYDDTARMLDEQEPDVVTIASPSGTHCDLALLAIERGVHVLCEKPLEITTERCDRIIQAAERAGVALGGIFPQRFNPVMQAVHGAAVAGRFGNVATANAYVPWWRDDAYYGSERWQGTLTLDGGGALINQSIHAIDATQWIASAAGCGDVVEVFGFTSQRGHDPAIIEVEDTAVAAMRYQNGALGAILGCTSMYPGTFQRIHVAGRDGTAEVHEETLVMFTFRDDDPGDVEALKRCKGGSSGGGASDPMAIGHENHTGNITEFLNAIDEGRTPLVDGREARKSLAIVEAIYRSAKEGRPVAPA